MRNLELVLAFLFGFSLSSSQDKLPASLTTDLNKDGIQDTVKVNRTDTGFYELQIIDGKTNKSAQRFPRYSGYVGMYVGQDNNGKYLIYFTNQGVDGDNNKTKKGFKIFFDNSTYTSAFKEFKEGENPELFE